MTLSIYLVVVLTFIVTVHAFRPGGQSRGLGRKIMMAVTEIMSSAALDAEVADAGEGLVVIDYSTTWCGPCKMVLPQFVELSEKYPNVKFLKCIGDSSADASALMKREGVRSVPSFHFWKAGTKIDSINGARIDDVEAIVKASG